MKIFLLSIAMILWIGCSDSVDQSTLLERSGLMYLPNSDEPYSGQTFSFHENGQKQMEGYYIEGKLDGVPAEWYENGQKK